MDPFSCWILKLALSFCDDMQCFENPSHTHLLVYICISTYLGVEFLCCLRKEQLPSTEKASQENHNELSRCSRGGSGTPHINAHTPLLAAPEGGGSRKKASRRGDCQWPPAKELSRPGPKPSDLLQTKRSKAKGLIGTNAHFCPAGKPREHMLPGAMYINYSQGVEAGGLLLYGAWEAMKSTRWI